MTVTGVGGLVFCVGRGLHRRMVDKGMGWGGFMKRVIRSGGRIGGFGGGGVLRDWIVGHGVGIEDKGS